MNTDSNTLWIARDRDGSLWAYDEKPVLSDNGVWNIEDLDHHDMLEVPEEFYPDLTYENSPRRLTLKTEQR